MIVALDNSFLCLLFKSDARPTPDPSTGKPVDFCKERLDAIIDLHSKNGDLLVIPAPSLAEMLTAIPSISQAVEIISNSSVFQVAPFDLRCAIELGVVCQEAIKRGDKKGGVGAGWQEVKFDRQIAVIAKVNGAEIFYSDDANQTNFAEALGLNVKHTWELPLPAKYAQHKLDL